MNAEKLANALGWFSLGLGLAELVAAEQITDALGLEDRAGMVRFYGLREVGAGIGILSMPRPVAWLWGRVGGDGLDLATLATALGKDNPKRANAGIAFGAVAVITVVDILCGLKLNAGD